MSAADVIAEAVPHFDGCTDWTPGDDFFCWCKAYRRDIAEAVVAAIRAWPVSEQAEVIGGEVEWASGERGYGDCAEQWPDREDAEMDAQSIRQHGLDGVLFARLAAGPWREVQP